MRQLTQIQKEFLLDYFFKDERFAGWKNIATKLLEKGRCIVAGTDCIWNGGIGNFIKLSLAENTYGCLLYEFDLDNFLSSKFYKEISGEYIDILAGEKRVSDQKLEEIINL